MCISKTDRQTDDTHLFLCLKERVREREGGSGEERERE